MSEAPLQARRRRLVIGAAALGVIGFAGYRGGWLSGLLPERAFDFEVMSDPAGYRILPSGPISAGGVPLFGLEGEKPAGLLDAEAVVERDICRALFGSGARVDGAVPIAYFFDYECPICRRLTPRLRALNGVQIAWHDLAGLGPGSLMAARATIAAGAQGAYHAFHDRLMRARFQANDGYVRALATSIGIDADRLIADMDNPAVAQRMFLSRALADKFGMIGTPGMVVGRTVVIGDINARD
ncbi:MAG: DsbA family protein, partial [Paracoccaceae bacterium]